MKKILATILASALGLGAWGVTVTTEADLRTAIASGGAVTLGGNIALTGGEIAVGTTVTLDLGTYTISAASGNIFQVVANGNFTVNADDTNPGGLTVGTTNACIYTAYGLGSGPRTIVINGGVFTGNCVFNFSPDATNNIHTLYGILPEGSGSGEKADPTSVTINGGTFTGGYEEGNVGAYRCYYFTVNGGTFERGLDSADTPTCSIGVTTTCKAFFTGGRYKTHYPTFRRKNGADDSGKVFIGTATHTNVYYYADGYYVNAYDYSACEVTGKWRGAMVEDANILVHFVTQCWQCWMTRPTRKVWYFLTLADAQSVNAGDITFVNGTESSGNARTSSSAAAAKSVTAVLASVKSASPARLASVASSGSSGKRLASAAADSAVPLANGNKNGDNTSPASVAESWKSKIKVSSIAEWESNFDEVESEEDYCSRVLEDLDARLDAGSVKEDELDELEEQLVKFKNREDMEACYVFSKADGVSLSSGDWKIVVKLSKAATANSLEFYVASDNRQYFGKSVDKRVWRPQDGSSLEYVLPSSADTQVGESSPSQLSGTLKSFTYKSDVAINASFPFLVAVKDLNGENVGTTVEVQLRNGDEVCAAYTHTIGANIVTTPVQAANCFGAIKISGNTAANMYVAVPFEGFEADGAARLAKDVVHPANLTAETKMYVYNTGADSHDVYTVASGAWAPATKVTIDSNNAATLDSADLKREVGAGSGVLVERKSTSDAVYVYGQIPSAGTNSKTFGLGRELVAPPYTNATVKVGGVKYVDLNAATWTGVKATTSNRVLQNGADYVQFRDESNNLRQYFFEKGSWGVPPRQVAAYGVLVKDGKALVPQGTAFWYCSSAGGAKVEWK